MNPPLIQIDTLRYRYPASGLVGGKRDEALKGASLELFAGERLALLGANGAGKSTLLLQLNGTLRPDSGTLRHRGRDYDYSRSGLRKLRAAVALVFQDPDDQLFAGTIRQDVSFGPFNLGLDEAEVARRVDEALEAMDLGELAEFPPHQLSHGQKKRAAIAGALAMRPDLLVLDEPTSGLDYPGLRNLADHLVALSDGGMSIVLSTHDIEFAAAWASRVVVLQKGSVIADGPSREILADRILLEAAGLRPPFRAWFGL